MIIFAAIAGIAALFLVSQNAKGGNVPPEQKRLFGLPDVTPAEQGGTMKRDYDLFFAAAADEFGPPFTLLKAHAMMESSLNPRAFRDENPSKRTDRLGWASRGLMQTLFWPGSTRFEKYGFDSDRSPDDLFDPQTNIEVAAQLVRDNLNACGGNIRDAINMYNTGKKEAQYAAPNNYVDRVLTFYETLIKKEV